MRMRLLSLLLSGTALTAIAAGPVASQEQPFGGRPAASVNFGLQVGQAVGEFANYVDLSGGFDVNLIVRPPGSPLGFRMGGQFLIYGSSTRRYPFLPGVEVDVTTTHAIAGLTLGPQLTLGTGAIQAYAFGGIGFSYFGTSSSASGSGSSSPFATSNNYEDVTFASEGGGGLFILVSRRRYVQLDVSARFLNNGRVTYVTEEGLSVCDGGTRLCVDPVESQANLVIYRIGASIGLRGRRDGDHSH